MGEHPGRRRSSGRGRIVVWALLICLGINEPVATESTHPTAVAVSAEYRAFYERERRPDWALTRLGRPGPAPTSAVWAGVVSHHLLAAPFIHDWFISLAAARDVERFVILAPRHFRQGSGGIVTSRRAWTDGENTLSVDNGLIDQLVECRLVEEDDASFYREHAIGTLVPFLLEYFPEARIVPVLIDPALPRDDRIEGLAETLGAITETDPRTFILVSADFSHHRAPAATEMVDAISGEILRELTPESARRVISDNTRGLRIIAEIAGQRERSGILVRANTDSWLLRQQDAPDTTSYFFMYFE